MLAQDGYGTADFKNGNEDGWPAKWNENKKEPSKKTLNQEKRHQQKKTHHAMGKVTNNDINCIKLKPIDFAPSDSSK